MKTTKVKELMVPIGEYAQLDETRTLYDAIVTLRSLQKEKKENLHTSVLIVTQEGDIATMLTILDIFRFMEPKYKEVQEIDLSRFGMQPGYVEEMLESYDLWANPLEDFCRKTGQVFLKDINRKMIPRDVIESNATLDTAVHRMIVDNKHSLLVKEKNKFVGVLRSFDIFRRFCEAIDQCEIS
ncbi:CBS domain-containing protein [Desulfoplanes sp.]